MEKCIICGSKEFGMDKIGQKFCKRCGAVIQQSWNGRRFFG